MSNEELTKYLNGINDAWQFLKFYLQHPDYGNDAWWADMVHKAEMIAEKHENKLITRIVCEMVGEIERVSGVMETWKNERAS